jgi:hypothetical protein
LVNEVLINELEVPGSGVNEASGGDGVDESWDPARVVMDETLGVRVEEGGVAPDVLESEVDVEAGLIARERPEAAADGDAVQQIKMGGPFEVLGEEVLAGEEDLDLWSVVEAGGDEEPEIGEGVGSEELALVDDEQGDGIEAVSVIEDAKEEAILASAWRVLAQGGEQDLEQGEGSEVGEMDVDGMEASDVEGVDEELQEGTFADASGSGEESEETVVEEVVQTGEGLTEAVILEKVLDWDVLAERVVVHLEVLCEHVYSFGLRFWARDLIW